MRTVSCWLGVGGGVQTTDAPENSDTCSLSRSRPPVGPHSCFVNAWLTFIGQPLLFISSLSLEDAQIFFSAS